MNFIIDQHNNLLSKEIFEFLDSNINSNTLKDIKSTQKEIIEYVITNNLDNIEVKYHNYNSNSIEYIIKYKTNNDTITIIPTEPNSVHLVRLLGLKNIKKYSLSLNITIDKLFLQEILLEINCFFDQTTKFDPMDYCSVCGKKLYIIGLNKILCCDRDTCKLESKHIVMDNRISELYKKDPYLCEFLINILISGTKHPKEEKIFKPLPIIKNIKNLSEFKNLIKIESDLNNLNIKNLSKSADDIELLNLIGSSSYAIINNSISDNFFSLSTIENFKTEIFNRGVKLIQNSPFESPDVKFIGLNYSYNIEYNFPKEYYLFHGAPIYSWYPIIKNGLKVMSGTEFQSNGASYGNGVYLSDTFSLSLGYSKIGINLDKNNKNPNIVGVFEIAKDIAQYNKCNGIYVVPDDKVLLLRYLIVIHNNFSNFQELTDYFIKYLGSINKDEKKKSTDIKNKRLCVELKLLNSNNKISDVQIISESANWIIRLKDIQNKKNQLNVYFTDYPKLPPKILLESELKINKIINNNMEIILQELKPLNWEVTIKLTNIVDIIYNCLLNSV